MFRGKKYISFVVAFSVFFSIGWLFNGSMANNDDVYHKIDKGLFYLKEVFEKLSHNYVDEIDPKELSESAIDGMLEEFDPYTVFFEDPGSHQMRMITRGKYGGVGMEIGIQNDQITVIAPMEDTPAKKAGIQAGDIIIKIDGISTEELSLEEASQKLRGKVGTEVTIEIERPGIETPITLELTRQEIVLNDVTYADFIESNTVYIKLSAFSDKAGRELKQAIRQLQSQKPIHRIILDLRGNPGGLLTSAVEVADIFLPAGELVVSTRGFHENENEFLTKDSPLLATQPLVILVNQSSASASEIVAGAIQDLDRGVLVGKETFGKGLVQKVYPIDKISQSYLKITTAKYYTPSGRSIQKEHYKENSELFVNLSDTTEYDKNVDYYTKNGRVVHGGGGIHPDIIAEQEEMDRFLRNLQGRGYLFRFTVDYLSQHSDLREADTVKVSDQVLAQFKSFLQEEEFDYQLEGEKELEKFLEISEKEGYGADVQDLVTVTMQKLQARKKNRFTKQEEQIRWLLEAEFADQLHGSKARTRKMLSKDQQVKKAIQVLQNMQQYQQILAINE